MYTHSLKSIFIFLLTAFSFNLYSEHNFLIGIDGAPAVTVGSDINQLSTGYSLALDGAYVLTPIAQVGGRFSYTNWSPLREAFLQSIAGSSSVTDVEGSTWSMEIAPLFRMTTNFTDNIINIFGQVGAGLYIINATTTVHYLDTLGLEQSQALGNGTQANFGFSLGAGVTIGKPNPVMVRLYPIWNFIVRSKQPRRYWTFNGGIVIGL